jgi:hypothetical protein
MAGSHCRLLHISTHPAAFTALRVFQFLRVPNHRSLRQFFRRAWPSYHGLAPLDRATRPSYHGLAPLDRATRSPSLPSHAMARHSGESRNPVGRHARTFGLNEPLPSMKPGLSRAKGVRSVKPSIRALVRGSAGSGGPRSTAHSTVTDDVAQGIRNRACFPRWLGKR